MKVEAKAKINLTLEVFGKRADGYHALRSLVVPISLADTIEIEPTDDGCITSDSPYPDDLCIKAARILREGHACRAHLRDGHACRALLRDGHACRALLREGHACRALMREGHACHALMREGHACRAHASELLGAHIHVEKRIPAGGGLGGGSADAAAVIVALNELWGLHLDRASLCEVAAQVGSDVPALVFGGAVVMEGRGEKVSDFGDFPPFSLVLVNPGVFSSTKEVYANCSPRMTDEPGILYNMRSALQSGDCERIGKAAVNDLALSACRLHPEIAEVMDALRSFGVANPAMTGSGSTVFGLVPNEARGREIAALMEAKGWKAWNVHSSVR